MKLPFASAPWRVAIYSEPPLAGPRHCSAQLSPNQPDGWLDANEGPGSRGVNGGGSHQLSDPPWLRHGTLRSSGFKASPLQRTLLALRPVFREPHALVRDEQKGGATETFFFSLGKQLSALLDASGWSRCAVNDISRGYLLCN